MKVHHLNCGTLRPLVGDSLVCHVLLVETNSGLVLVDSGFGQADISAPKRRIGNLTHVIRPDFAPHETALAQIEAMGYTRADVTHIVATHLDSDHCGGIDDFPGARLHVAALEQTHAQQATGISARIRYKPWRQTASPEAITTYAHFPDQWFGFDAAPLTDISDDLLLVPLPGHTPGHAGVAVRQNNSWIFHCGDAFYHRNAVSEGKHAPIALRLAQAASATDRRQTHLTRTRLEKTFAGQSDKVRLVCAHDPKMFAEAVQDA